MRGVVVTFLVGVVLSSASVAAQPVEGRGVGVDAFYASAGASDAYHFDHAGGRAVVVLSWSSLLLGVDYDLTVFRPGALDDGWLSQDEVVARSWSYGSGGREERVEVDLAAGRYVVTVEPVRAQGEAYVLEASGPLQDAALVPGVKLYV